jgi:transposase
MTDHLRFAEESDACFTNNNAEQGLRPLKTKLKVSGMFKTLEGANNHCGILSIISTAIKQNFNPIKVLTDSIKNKADILFA